MIKDQKDLTANWVWWCILVILVTWETEIGKTEFPSQPWPKKKKKFQDPISMEKG
jgi:hypothetical protein